MSASSNRAPQGESRWEQPDRRLLAAVAAKLAFVCSLGAACLVLWLSRRNGCDWPSALLRTAASATGCALAAAWLVPAMLGVLTSVAPQNDDQGSAQGKMNATSGAPSKA